MRKASELKGLPVVTFDTGKRIGEVKDTLLSLQSQRLLAFLVDDQGWSDNARVIPFQAVVSVGPDRLAVVGEDSTIKASQNPEVKEAMKSRKEITRMKVYSEDGGYLGTVDDAIIDEATGEIRGYDLCSYCDESLRGKRYVPETIDMGEATV